MRSTIVLTKEDKFVWMSGGRNLEILVVPVHPLMMPAIKFMTWIQVQVRVVDMGAACQASTEMVEVTEL